MFDSLLADCTPPVGKVLAEALAGQVPARDAAIALLSVEGVELRALTAVANVLRERACGGRVGFVVNRNINFTNVCIKNCKFCAFARDLRSEQGYFLPQEEVIRRVAEAEEFGATEVCVQAGLAPSVGGRIYIELCEAIHNAHPDVHIHAFSPEEVLYGVRRSGLSIREYLTELKAVGLGSLPGTSAEVLVERIRDEISPGRITRAQWVEIVTTAHELGVPTTSTMMYGHLETHDDIVEHLFALRALQEKTGGFTEFVPLAFVHADSPLYTSGEIKGVRPGPTREESLRVYALARLVLGDVIPNIQASWVKHGLDFAVELLHAGANDLGGTLMNESISTSAGAGFGQLMTPAALIRAIRDADREPWERSTLYAPVREYEPTSDFVHPLDRIDDADTRFGSYEGLVAEKDFHFAWEPKRRNNAATS